MLNKKFNRATSIACAVATVLSISSLPVVSATMTSGTFLMLDNTGSFVNNDTAVTGNIGGGTWSVASTNTFFGTLWTAHSGTTFGPGTYTWNTGAGTYSGVKVGAGQVGGHILFDWGTNASIDIVNVWDVSITGSIDNVTVEHTYTSTDVFGVGSCGVGCTTALGTDGFPGLGMYEAFPGFNANFSFTVPAPDTGIPVITLTGANPQVVVQNTAYSELGADCIDSAPQTAYTYSPVINASTVTTASIGDYTVTYDCADAAANDAIQVSRMVSVVPPDAAVSLLGSTPVAYECENTGATYADAGAQCDDPEDSVWTSADPNPPGTSLVLTGTGFSEIAPGGPYTLTWTCTDSAANTGTADRIVNVVDTTNPALGAITNNDLVSTLETATGPLYVEASNVGSFVNPTMEAVSDSCNTAIASTASVTGTVDLTVPLADGVNRQTSTLTFSADDGYGNVATLDLEVQVRRSEPVITLVGNAKVLLNPVGTPYVEEGMDIHDEQDGDVIAVTADGTSSGLTYTIDSSAVDVNTQGTYQVLYNVMDSDGNTAAQVSRTVVIGASYGNFTMLGVQGETFGGTNDVVVKWLNQTLNTKETDTNVNMTIVTDGPTVFNGNIWYAHHVRVFGPGTYSFDTTCTIAQIEAGTAVCGNPLPPGQTERYMTMTVVDGQLGAHMLFDWSSSTNIDVVNLWDQDAAWNDHGDITPKNELFLGCCGAAPDPSTIWELVSTDVNGDGVNGSPMVDGPFEGFYANFNNGPASTGASQAPITTTAQDTVIGGGAVNWLVLLGMLPLMGLFRRASK